MARNALLSILALLAVATLLAWFASGPKSLPSSPADPAARTPAASSPDPPRDAPEHADVAAGRREAALRAVHEENAIPGNEGESAAPPVGPPHFFARFVDEAGAPVEGVQLAWVLVRDNGASLMRPTGHISRADGRVRVPCASEALDARFRPDSNAAIALRGVAHVGLLASIPVEPFAGTIDRTTPGVRWIDAEPVPGSVIDVPLPPCGSLQITWDPPLGGDGTEIAPDRVIVSSSPEGMKPFALHANPTAGAHDCTVGPLGLGWDVTVVLDSARVVGPLGSVTAKGPTRAGEVVTVHVPFDERSTDLVTVAATMVTSAGVPHAKTTLFAKFRDEATGRRMASSATTDAEGRWTLEVPRSALAEPIRLEIFDVANQRATVELTRARPPTSARRVDLGLIEVDFETPKPVRIVGGYVRQRNGQPFPARGVHVKVWGDVRRGDGRVGSGEGVLIAQAPIDRNGHFEVVRDLELASGTLRLEARAVDAVAPVSRDVESGTEDVEFVLDLGSTVRMQIEADPWVASYELGHATLVGRDIDEAPRVGLLPDGRGGVMVRGCPPGRARLKVVLGNGEWVLYDQTIDVGPDVRLGLLDLRGALRECRLRLVDSRSSAVESAEIEFRDSASGTLIGRAPTDTMGHVNLLVPTNAGGLEIIGPSGRARVAASVFSVPVPGSESPRLDVVLGESRDVPSRR